MTVDGNFVISRTANTLDSISVSEWKPFQNEWVECVNASNTVFVPVGAAANIRVHQTTFSKDGMHFLTFESDNFLNPTSAGGHIRTFNFIN